MRLEVESNFNKMRSIVRPIKGWQKFQFKLAAMQEFIFYSCYARGSAKTSKHLTFWQIVGILQLKQSYLTHLAFYLSLLQGPAMSCSTGTTQMICKELDLDMSQKMRSHPNELHSIRQRQKLALISQTYQERLVCSLLQKIFCLQNLYVPHFATLSKHQFAKDCLWGESQQASTLCIR